MPSKRKNSSNGCGVKCFRLVSADPDEAVLSAQEVVVVPPDDDPPGGVSFKKK